MIEWDIIASTYPFCELTEIRCQNMFICCIETEMKYEIQDMN